MAPAVKAQRVIVANRPVRRRRSCLVWQVPGISNRVQFELRILLALAEMAKADSVNNAISLPHRQLTQSCRFVGLGRRHHRRRITGLVDREENIVPVTGTSPHFRLARWPLGELVVSNSQRLRDSRGDSHGHGRGAAIRGKFSLQTSPAPEARVVPKPARCELR